jgi:hypothetical protein
MMLIALAMTTASVCGMIGETPEEMATGKPVHVERWKNGNIEMTWHWRNVNQRGVFHKGRALIETFWFDDQNHVMTYEERVRFLRPYIGLKWDVRTDYPDAELVFMSQKKKNGVVLYVAMYHHETNALSVWPVELFDAVFIEKPKRTPTPAPVPKSSIDAYLDAPEVDKFAPAGPPQTDKNDCMVVATENLHRLASTAAWSGILAFRYVLDGGWLKDGHAVAVWKLSNDGLVYAVDSSGTYQLPTTSTDAREILNALGQRYAAEFNRRITLVGDFAK